MTRIGVISDSHRNVNAVDACVKAAGEVDIWLHLGDNVSDAQYLREETGKPVHMVRGNCDILEMFAPSEITLEIEGAKLLLTHGHNLRVKQGRRALYNRAKDLGAVCALYGHTHIAEISDMDGVLIANPGSPSEPREGAPSFMVLTVRPNGAHSEIDVELRSL